MDLLNEPQAQAQAYSSYLCLLAHNGEAPQLTAAIAMNFPPFGEICGRFADALREKYSFKDEDLEFLTFFWIRDLDEEAVKNIEAYTATEKGQQIPVQYKEIKRSVTLLQAYEDMFLDSVYDLKS